MAATCIGVRDIILELGPVGGRELNQGDLVALWQLF